ncbi:hypothetical protein L484_015249 [Morus notabilis]|uniref:Uncharacterized protein n=1 Tax=Morus notabilis TaxID=981085 RepID=W9S2R4_9ROSA|nr:hypothetical protein L484_015249 [Morus notabilis]
MLFSPNGCSFSGFCSERWWASYGGGVSTPDVDGDGACVSRSANYKHIVSPLGPRSVLPTPVALLSTVLSLKACGGRALAPANPTPAQSSSGEPRSAATDPPARSTGAREWSARSPRNGSDGEVVGFGFGRRTETIPDLVVWLYLYLCLKFWHFVLAFVCLCVSFTDLFYNYLFHLLRLHYFFFISVCMLLFCLSESKKRRIMVKWKSQGTKKNRAER